MPRLPEDWPRYTGGWLARLLLRQTINVGRRTHLARCLIWAAFDIGFAARWSKSAPHLTITERPRMVWKIGSFVYRFVPLVNDRTAHRLVKVMSNSCAEHLLTLPDEKWVLWTSMESQLEGRSPRLMGVDEFVDHRILFSSLDAQWEHDRAMVEFLSAFNRHAMSLHLKKPILVDTPGRGVLSPRRGTGM